MVPSSQPPHRFPPQLWTRPWFGSPCHARQTLDPSLVYPRCPAHQTLEEYWSYFLEKTQSPTLNFTGFTKLKRSRAWFVLCVPCIRCSVNELSVNADVDLVLVRFCANTPRPRHKRKKMLVLFSTRVCSVLNKTSEKKCKFAPVLRVYCVCYGRKIRSGEYDGFDTVRKRTVPPLKMMLSTRWADPLACRRGSRIWDRGPTLRGRPYQWK